MQKLKRICFLFLSVILILGCSFSSYANVYDLLMTDSNAFMVRTDSNAISTFGMPRSSIANVTNTVLWDSDVSIEMMLLDSSGTKLTEVLTPANFTPSANGLSIKYSAPSGYSIYGYNVFLKSLHFDFLPPSGNYNMSVDVSSHFSHDYNQPALWSQKLIDNASALTSFDHLQFTESSGDLYIPPFVIEVNNITRCLIQFMFNGTCSQVDSVIHVNFTKTSGNASVVMPGSGIPDQDDVSSSLSDLSSSVDTMTDEISGVTEAIQSLQGAMEPHYSNVLTQLHHITEQLHAFWDQQYNLHHVPMMEKLDGILNAVLNLDEVFENALSSVKVSIDNMSSALQSKLDSVKESITHGYQNSELDSAIDDLGVTLDDMEQVDQQLFIFSELLGSWQDMLSPPDLSGFAGAFESVSSFFSIIFNASSSLYALFLARIFLFVGAIVLGLYRFKG